MYFENKEIDPRDCLYRANSKIRNTLETLMLHKQAFSYNDLVKIHQLLQRMEEDPDSEKLEKRSKKSTPSFRDQFFFQFMENNFKVIQPEKRKNVVLDERIRKLKYQAARKEYDTMTSSVSRAFLGDSKGGKSGITIGQELRNIRSTLIATANAFMVIVATFAFFYMALGYVRPDTTIANRVLFSFSASMVVAVAEVYFLIRII